MCELSTRAKDISRTVDTTNKRERGNEVSERMIKCVYCKQIMFDLHAISGYKNGADWATEDGDFGCDLNPENTSDGVGKHLTELEVEV